MYKNSNSQTNLKTHIEGADIIYLVADEGIRAGPGYYRWVNSYRNHSGMDRVWTSSRKPRPIGITTHRRIKSPGLTLVPPTLYTVSSDTNTGRDMPLLL
eukprot:7142571-Ditylum_brightwellii.AAC.1